MSMELLTVVIGDFTNIHLHQLLKKAPAGRQLLV
jgi:hypothetical protein